MSNRLAVRESLRSDVRSTPDVGTWRSSDDRAGQKKVAVPPTSAHGNNTQEVFRSEEVGAVDTAGEVVTRQCYRANHLAPLAPAGAIVSGPASPTR